MCENAGRREGEVERERERLRTQNLTKDEITTA